METHWVWVRGRRLSRQQLHRCCRQFGLLLDEVTAAAAATAATANADLRQALRGDTIDVYANANYMAR